MFMIQFETLPVLLILSNAGSISSFCRIWIIQAPALVDLRRRSFIMIIFSRTVPGDPKRKYFRLTKHQTIAFCSDTLMYFDFESQIRF